VFADLLPFLYVEIILGVAFGVASILVSRLSAVLAVVLATVLTIVLATTFWGPAGGVIAGLIFGLPAELAGVAIADRDRIKIAERLGWTWRRAIWGSVIGLCAGLLYRLVAGSSADLDEVLGVGSPVGLAVVLALGFTRSTVIETRTRPNQGIRKSAQNAIRVGSIVVLAVALIGIPIGVLAGELAEVLSFMLFVGLPIGSAIGIAVGGGACIQHLLLRLILYRQGYVPWNLSRFLDHATERILMRQVGGGYIFIHRLLLDHFAALGS
jgi:hypothetical protein